MFISQLYSKLEENNDIENRVMRWSRRKDIFHKKIIFIPIEKGLHYVYFNPPPIGRIPNMYPSYMLYIYGSGRVIDRVLV